MAVVVFVGVVVDVFGVVIVPVFAGVLAIVFVAVIVGVSAAAFSCLFVVVFATVSVARYVEVRGVAIVVVLVGMRRVRCCVFVLCLSLCVLCLSLRSLFC